MINEKLARHYWPGQEAVGKRIRVPGDPQMRMIVGVARIANYTSWAAAGNRRANGTGREPVESDAVDREGKA